MCRSITGIWTLTGHDVHFKPKVHSLVRGLVNSNTATTASERTSTNSPSSFSLKVAKWRRLNFQVCVSVSQSELLLLAHKPGSGVHPASQLTLELNDSEQTRVITRSIYLNSISTLAFDIHEISLANVERVAASRNLAQLELAKTS